MFIYIFISLGLHTTQSGKCFMTIAKIIKISLLPHQNRISIPCFRIVLRVIFFNTTNIQLYRNTYSKTIFVQNAHLHCLGTNSNKVNYYFTRINFTISPCFSISIEKLNAFRLTFTHQNGTFRGIYENRPLGK